METLQEKIKRNDRLKLRERQRIEDGGVSHEGCVTRFVGLPDMADPVDPVVEPVNDDDGFYVQVFRSRSELVAFVTKLLAAADDAWPPQDA